MDTSSNGANAPRDPQPDDLQPSARENLQQIREFQGEEEAEVSRLQSGIEAISRFFGSPAYFVSAFVFMLAWIAVNLFGSQAGWRHVDEPPFFALQGLVSANALFLTVAVLIRQSRMSEQEARRAHLDLHINLLTEEKVSKVLQVVHAMANQLGGAATRDESVEALSTATDPKAILSAIREGEKKQDSG